MLLVKFSCAQMFKLTLLLKRDFCSTVRRSLPKETVTGRSVISVENVAEIWDSFLDLS